MLAIKSWITILFILIIVLDSNSQNIIQNGEFIKSIGFWNRTGTFYYDEPNCTTTPCSSGNPYAFTALNSCSNIDNASGVLWQETQMISTSATGGVLSLKHRTGTSQPLNIVIDRLQIIIEYNSQSFLISEITNANASPTACTELSFDISTHINNRKGQTFTLKFVSIQQNDGLITVFRIDDVRIDLNTAPTTCTLWENGTLPANSIVREATEYLCKRNIISNYQSVSNLLGMSIGECAYVTLSGFYNGNVPLTLQSDNFPTLLTDIEILPFHEWQSIKALSFLERGDGRACIKRDFLNIQPKRTVSYGMALRMLLEAWNIAPDTTGMNVFSHTSSTFLSNVYTDDAYYGYYKKARQIGLLNNFIVGNSFTNPSPGEFVYVVLYNLHTIYGIQNQDANTYYTPNNFSVQNSGERAGIERSVFENYEGTGFSIPSGGLGLDFDFSYHSNLVDMPFLNSDWVDSENSDLRNAIAILKNNPLGRGWSHSYHIYGQVFSGLNANGTHLNEKFIIIRWGDGTFYLYNIPEQKFVTKGIYDQFTPVAYDVNNNITEFKIKTKALIEYSFYRVNNQFECRQIKDRNNNAIQLGYEFAECPGLSPGVSCFATTAWRLKWVTDQIGGRQLIFDYQVGTNLISEVRDNIGRSIKFFVNRNTHNLDSTRNANNNTTKYRYCVGDTCSNLLIEIQRPKGNWIKNSYAKRKLQKTQTPNYSASVNFGTNYNSSGQTTQSQIVTTPSSGTTYSVSYQHNMYGQPTSATLAGSTTQIEYNDGNNPTLPTRVIDNPTGVVTAYTYDVKGNQLSQTVTGGAITQFTQQWFNANNDVTEIQQPNGSKFQYGYNATGNLISETGPHGYKVLYTRNPNGTINTKTTANNVVTKFSYNSYGNPSQILIEGTNIKIDAAYDNVSRVTHVKDPLGVVSKYVYDNNDNIIQTIIDTSQLKLTTSYKFDLNDNSELVIAPNGDSTKLIYDASDLLVEEKYGQQVRKWVYFEDGTLNTIQTKNGVQYWSEYYSSGSPFEGKLKIQHLTELFYDNTTKLLNRRKRFNVTHHYTYDALQRITGVQFKDSLGTSLTYASEVKYEYNNSGFQTKIDIPEVNKHFRYIPDSLNRVFEVYDWNNTLIVRYTYRADGLINTEHLANGATVFYHYDNAGRLDSMYAKSNNGTMLYSIGATLDDKGNHIAESYYVNKGSLPVITAPFSQTTINYQYDSKTNRLTKTNNLTATSDNNGNILQDNYTGFGITGATTTYDLFDNITRCNVDSYTHNFKYDPLDIRYSVDTNTYINDFLNNGNVLVQKRTGIGVQKLYCHSPLGLVCSIDNTTNQRRWYLYDFRGSAVAILNDNQTVVEYYKYEPFGSIMESSHTPGTTTPFLYVGRHGVEYQSPHLYYMRARYYDPTNGRFYGEDPIWNTNLFVYGDNNPLSNIDPNGKMANPWAFNGQLKGLNESIQNGKPGEAALYTLAIYGSIASGTLNVMSFGKMTTTTRIGFNSFNSFKKVYGPAGKGQAWHHIVEQHAHNIVKFGSTNIHHPTNLIKLPSGAGSIHAKITGYYNSLIPGTSMRVRDYVKTLNYKQQYQYGLDVLKRFK
jgi:RHS repeat-associated protein